MKGLLKRDCYNFFRPGMLIALLGTIFLLCYVGVVYPLRIYNNYVPEMDSLFRDMDRALLNAHFALGSLPFETCAICIVFIVFFARSIIRKDAESRWNMYLAVTPVKHRTYVIEKYILIFCAIVFLSIPIPVSSIIYKYIGSKYDTGFSLVSFDVAKEYILSLVFMQAFLFFAMSSFLPLLFLLGSRNKVGVFFIACGVASGEAIISYLLYEYYKKNMQDIAIILFIISLGLFILSCWGSIMICKKRQF